MNRAGIVGGTLLFAAVIVAWFAPISSAKPPVPPPPPRTWSYYDANGQSYGGLRDSSTGLVWGFTSVNAKRFACDPGAAGSWNGAMNLVLGQCDPSTYSAVSNTYWSRNDTDWRLPTKDEIVDSLQGGLMASLDASMDPGFQTFIDENGNIADAPASTWTSTQKGKPYAYMVSLYNAVPSLVPIAGSSSSWIPVRGPVAP